MSFPRRIVSSIKYVNNSPRHSSFLFVISKLLNGILFDVKTLFVAFFCALFIDWRLWFFKNLNSSMIKFLLILGDFFSLTSNFFVHNFLV